MAFIPFGNAAGHVMSHISALMAAGYLDVAMPPEVNRFRTIEEISEIVHMDSPGAHDITGPG